MGVVQVQHVEHQGQLLLEQRLVGRVPRCAARGGEPAELGAEALVHGQEAAELGQRAVVMVETGRLGDFLPVMERAYAATDVPGFGFGLGLARFATGDVDGARRLLVTTPMPSRDYTWLSAAATRLLLALEVGDLGVVRESRDLLEPFSGQLAVTGTTTNVLGAYDGHLGEASLALGEVDRARLELSAAVRLLERNGAAYWLVRARQALANCA